MIPAPGRRVLSPPRPFFFLPFYFHGQFSPCPEEDNMEDKEMIEDVILRERYMVFAMIKEMKQVPEEGKHIMEVLARFTILPETEWFLLLVAIPTLDENGWNIAISKAGYKVLEALEVVVRATPDLDPGVKELFEFVQHLYRKGGDEHDWEKARVAAEVLRRRHTGHTRDVVKATSCFFDKRYGTAASIIKYMANKMDIPMSIHVALAKAISDN